MEGYPGAAEETLEHIALEHFFRGCLDKQSASIAMSKNPKTVSKAIRYVKEAANKQKLLFGNKCSHSVRKVSFAPGAQSESSGEEVTNWKVRQVQIPSANSHTALSSKTKEAVTVKQVSDLVERVETLETLVRKRLVLTLGHVAGHLRHPLLTVSDVRKWIISLGNARKQSRIQRVCQ